MYSQRTASCTVQTHMYSKCNVGDFAVPRVQILVLVKLQVKSEFLHDKSYSKMLFIADVE